MNVHNAKIMKKDKKRKKIESVKSVNKKSVVKRPKLMCPIRDWASLEACKDYADEVYFSVSALSLRQKSNNLTLAELPKFVEKCADYKITPFLTINSVVYNNDLKTAEKIIKKANSSF